MFWMSNNISSFQITLFFCFEFMSKLQPYWSRGYPITILHSQGMSQAKPIICFLTFILLIGKNIFFFKDNISLLAKPWDTNLEMLVECSMSLRKIQIKKSEEWTWQRRREIRLGNKSLQYPSLNSMPVLNQSLSLPCISVVCYPQIVFPFWKSFQLEFPHL